MRRIHPLFRSIFTAHFSRIAIQGRSRGTATRTAVFTVIFHHPVRNGNCERVPSCMGDSYSCLCRAHPILHPIPSTQWIAGEPAVIRFTGSCRWSKRSHPLFRRNSSNFSRECTLFLLLLKETTLRTSAFLPPPFPPPFFVFDGTRFVRFSISRQKSAKENFYVEKVCFQNLNQKSNDQRWTILFKISIENCYERY